MSHSDYIRREREREAHNVAKRAMSAANRAAGVLKCEDVRVDAAIGVDGTARALDTYFGALDARADIVRTVADKAAGVCKPATAAHMTRALRADGVAACAYADRKDVTGALHAPKMRVRKQGGGAPSDVCGPRMAMPGIGAEQIMSARAVACATLRDAIAQWFAGTGGKVGKNAQRSRILGVLHTWEGDAEVAQCARTCGWV